MQPIPAPTPLFVFRMDGATLQILWFDVVDNYCRAVDNFMKMVYSLGDNFGVQFARFYLFPWACFLKRLKINDLSANPGRRHLGPNSRKYLHKPCAGRWITS
jgi:hypothetical protein